MRTFRQVRAYCHALIANYNTGFSNMSNKINNILAHNSGFILLITRMMLV